MAKLKFIIKYKDTLQKIVSTLLTVGITYNPKEILDNTLYFRKVTARFKTISIIMKIKPKSYLKRHTILYKEYCTDKKALAEKKWISLFEKLSDDEKMMAIHFLYESGCFDNDSSNVILKYALETNNKNYRYWITQNIEKMTFYCQRGLFENYYVNRKQAFRKIVEDLDIVVPSRKEDDGYNRLCIMTYLLDGSIHNSMQRVAMMVANNMLPYYSEVLVVNLDSFVTGNDDGHELGCMIKYKQSKTMQKGIREMFHDKVSIYYSEGNNYKKRFQNAINKIYEYNPNLIIDITDEFSPISYLYNNDYKTVFLPLRFGASSSYYSAIIERQFIFDIWNAKYRFGDEQKVIDWYFPEYVPPKMEPYSRCELGFSDTSFILVTVGKCDELCTQEFFKEMINLLGKYQDIIWLVIGGKVPLHFHNIYPEIFAEKRIIEWGFEKNLRGLLAVCDVHLRLNTVGSGGATAMAAMEGLPIAMTNYMCDAICWLGLDYTSNTTYKDLFDYVIRLYEDKEFYGAEKKRVLELVSKVLDTGEKWAELHELLNDV